MKIFQLWHLIRVGLTLAGWRVEPKLISQLIWFTPLTNIYFRLGGGSVSVCERERHLILYTKLSKYNLYYLWSIDSHVYKISYCWIDVGTEMHRLLIQLYYFTLLLTKTRITPLSFFEMWNSFGQWMSVIWSGYVFCLFSKLRSI